MSRRILVLGLALSALLTVFTAAPAHAVTTYACNPTPSTWNVVARWGDGSVMEARTCLQHDPNTGYVRTKSQWRTRRGTTALLSDWDLDINGDNRWFQTQVYSISFDYPFAWRADFSDVFNTSYLALYSRWSCYGSTTQRYQGMAWDLRATPPGLTRSGYHQNNSDVTEDALAAC
jgi:hypothetical protein